MTITLLLLAQLFFPTFLFSEVIAIYNDGNVEISWSTPEQIQVDYYVIERSRNGRKYKVIRKVDVPKNNSGSIDYYEIDSHPLKKKAFYRIRQVDRNGTRHYSNTVLVHNMKMQN